MSLTMYCEIHKHTQLEYRMEFREYYCPLCEKVIQEALQREKERVEKLYRNKENQTVTVKKREGA